MKLIANASIGVKVALAPAFALLCLAILALSAWWSTRSLMHAFDQVGTVNVVSGWTTPSSNAAAAVTTFMIDPGS